MKDTFCMAVGALGAAIASLYGGWDAALIARYGVALPRMLEDWAREAGVDVVRYPPNWKMYGKQAERRRNRFMLTDSRPDVVIALPGGDDTCALISRARAAGIHVVTVNN